MCLNSFGGGLYIQTDSIAYFTLSFSVNSYVLISKRAGHSEVPSQTLNS